MEKKKIDALVSFKSNDRLLVGRERILLIESIAEHGSITKAAKAIGCSYKTAWEAVEALNYLIPTPAVMTKTGGYGGGGSAHITEEGIRLIATFHRIEDKLVQFSNKIAQSGLNGNEELLLLTFGAKISARNKFPCVVKDINKGIVEVELRLITESKKEIVANVTNLAHDELDIKIGKSVIALVNAYSVTLSEQRWPDKENSFLGAVTKITKGTNNYEIFFNFDVGKTLIACISSEQASKLDVKKGKIFIAQFDSKDIIVAVN